MKQLFQKLTCRFSTMTQASVCLLLLALLVISFASACEEDIPEPEIEIEPEPDPEPTLICVPNLIDFLDGEWEFTRGDFDSLGNYIQLEDLDTITYVGVGTIFPNDLGTQCRFGRERHTGVIVSDCEITIKRVSILPSNTELPTLDLIYTVQYYGDDEYMLWTTDDNSPWCRKGQEYRRIN